MVNNVFVLISVSKGSHVIWNSILLPYYTVERDVVLFGCVLLVVPGARDIKVKGYKYEQLTLLTLIGGWWC